MCSSRCVLCVFAVVSLWGQSKHHESSKSMIRWRWLVEEAGCASASQGAASHKKMFFRWRRSRVADPDYIVGVSLFVLLRGFSGQLSTRGGGLAEGARDDPPRHEGSSLIMRPGLQRSWTSLNDSAQKHQTRVFTRVLITCYNDGTYLHRYLFMVEINCTVRSGYATWYRYLWESFITESIQHSGFIVDDI